MAQVFYRLDALTTNSIKAMNGNEFAVFFNKKDIASTIKIPQK